MTVIVVLLVGHSIDAMMTHNFARKGHYPLGSPPSPASQPAKLPQA
jgi:hypothetical protein